MALKSVVVVDIDRPEGEVGELFADPRNSSKWMLDLDRYEPLSGEEGMPGSTYRLSPKTGETAFVVTVLARDLPRELHLSLEGSNVHVDLVAGLTALSPSSTRLTSQEVFTFRGLFGPLVPAVASKAIKAAHRKAIEEFKRFAESRVGNPR
jgi:hypothetical protein